MKPTVEQIPAQRTKSPGRTMSADMGVAKEIPERASMRALRSFYFESPTGCHISTYSIGSHGYAQVGWQVEGGPDRKRDATTAHRAAWTAVWGQIPIGMTIDHTCKNYRCVNILHLRMLTNFENARRTAGRDWPLGQCVNGHVDEYMHQQRGGKWVCAPCMQAARDRWIEKNRTKTER